MYRTFILLLFAALVCTAQGQISTVDHATAVREFDTLFGALQFDTLQVSPNKFRKVSQHAGTDRHEQWAGQPIPKRLAGPLQLPVAGQSALKKIAMDAQGDITGYLIGMDAKKEVRCYLYSEKQAKFLTYITLASYDHLPGAYEERINSWLLDLDGNGSLDIATLTDLQDFEMPTELYDNISHSKQYVHFLKDGKLEYAAWEAEWLPDVRLQK